MPAHAAPAITSRWRVPATIATAALCVGGVVCTALQPGTAAAAREAPSDVSTTISIERFAFKDGEPSVKAGTRVRWVNHDETPHTVAARDGSFLSPGMDTDDQFEHTFAQPGDFVYFCTLHPFMTGTIHVRP